jgi:hypothetical protein
MNTDWEKVLLAYLHDPPDKARKIQGHEYRAAALASIAFGDEVTRDRLHDDTRTEDQLGSVADRVPMPTAGTNGERAVGPEGGSYLLSWLTFAAMRPVLDAAGPGAFVFPVLIGLVKPPF